MHLDPFRENNIPKADINTNSNPRSLKKGCRRNANAMIFLKFGDISIVLKNGTTKAMTYSTKRRMPKWTEERRKKQGDAIRASFTEERRQRMSESMKKVRREKYWHSKGKSKRSQQP